jgi:hypothetical protein
MAIVTVQQPAGGAVRHTHAYRQPSRHNHGWGLGIIPLPGVPAAPLQQQNPLPRGGQAVGERTATRPEATTMTS